MTAFTEETAYDRGRLAQWRAGEARLPGLSRRDLLRLTAAGGLALAVPGTAAAAAGGPIVKPLPPELFDVHGSNAETRWEAMSGQGYLTPVDRFFVRDHTSTPVLDADTWRLRLFGSGLRKPAELSYRELRALPSETITAFIECAGNGRSFFTSQQGQTVAGTAWKLGAVGVARWRGVRLATVLARAGLTRHAVDVLPEGLDADYVTAGVNLGKVRRPLPVAKALEDVLLAYEMNGQPLPPDHGFPVRLVVPSWAGIASIKWLGRIEVSATPLVSPWNTQYYRLLGPDYPAEGTLVTEQVVKSAFELPWDATLAAGRRLVLRGRSWSGHGRIRRVEVSTDGVRWHPAKPISPALDRGWLQWEFPWRPRKAGAYTLRARAIDVTGVRQPDVAPYNTQGYLFGAVVRHPVTVSAS
ncbi:MULTISPECIES: sulfite oxidase [unclassified Amycolatopsis]|uniref:sulfite oxidase n=1 Tax=unclassified Amycolatopsis TaxID=2618356 RepID=UPI002875A54B|nr:MULTISPECIES: sulfite oxidase [unclassified Amycolatopsis]MDS0136164.1 sulfite oxidase [Amycolatopsis sp. 505]MDS0145247.1 sulfite oxidase [Amycolatopsis sp. CM201R]